MSDGVSRQAIEWAAFFAEFERPLTVYAVSLTGHIEDARDLMQDVMTRLVQTRANPDNRKQFVMKALRNRVIDLHRGESSRRSVLENRGGEQARLLERSGSADRDDATEEAERLLASLSEHQREVVVLRLYAGFTFSEIADVLDKPLGTITSLYARSLDRMRQAAAGEMHHAR